MLTETPPVPSPPGPATSVSRGFRNGIAALMAVGLAVRLTFVLVLQSRVTQLPGDAGWYHFQAKLVADGMGFLNPVYYYDSGALVPGAQHPPGFVLLLALLDVLGISTPQGQRVVMCLIGTVSIAVVGLLGRRLAGERAGLLAAALAAVYPNLWINDGMLLTETIVVLATAVALLFTYRYFVSERTGDLMVVSAALTASMLVRPESSLMFVVLLLPLVLSRTRLRWSRRAAQLALAALLPALCLAPWFAYNLSRFDEPVLLSTGMGQTLLAGNCDATFSGDKLGFWDFSCLGDPIDIDGGRADLSSQDAKYREQALDYMSEHRDRLPTVVAARVLRVWGVFRPSQAVVLDGLVEGRAGGDPGGDLRIAREAQWSYFVLAPLAVLGALVLRRRRVQLLPLFAQALIVTLVAASTFGLTRYRAGFEVTIVVLAAVALGRLWTSLTGVVESDAVRGPLRPGAPTSDPEHVA